MYHRPKTVEAYLNFVASTFKYIQPWLTLLLVKKNVNWPNKVENILVKTFGKQFTFRWNNLRCFSFSVLFVKQYKEQSGHLQNCAF